ncbi:sigma-70 family RNA polymerase sigma factor [Corallococcus sp. CA053C]|uniref:RNA polymerase sigma factor n=1 Tax=Corallococcus sp. CA053C TaxID=2316732 RepID=UPI000EA1B6E7|nr:sigma-70 family RNA polymerase sigma factor [Corallococcus sp. CA053C]RKG97151.1 sigma-70 family RNA polymerase sigma factor [Corallococcus sp. CA053C]
MASGLGAEELRELYERFAPVVHRRALALLGRDADAWDIVQEVFERMLTAGARFRREARPMTYVYRVTTNLCLNALRTRRSREPKLPEREEAATLTPSQWEAADFIRHLVGRMGERELEVATLHFFDGLTQEAIAQMLDVSRKTIVRDLESIRKKAAELGRLPEAAEADRG